MFHSKDGLFFCALGQGAVRIIKTSDGKWPYTRSTDKVNEAETNITCDVTLEENEWASVVCSVSQDGETYERWMQARRFHGTDLPVEKGSK